VSAEPAVAPTRPVHGDPALVVEDLVVRFDLGGGLLSRTKGQVRAVDGVSFDVRRGEVFGLVGESGSGKTTLGRALLGLVPATSGSIRWEGSELVGLRERELRPLRRRLAMVFQDPNASLNPAMTIGQGVGHPLLIHRLTRDRRETRARVVEMLERCGLTPPDRFLDVYPEDLSGGQKQRAVLARALITDPDLVVADEPVAALDMSVRAKVLDLLLQLREELDLTCLYITHDLASGKFVCDRLAIMYLGRFVEWGASDRIYAEPQHPYTRALLDALPQPDPARKGREKSLPRGEIPDALAPPSGCPFHPRCPAAFDACGWEGRDVVDAIEARWGDVDEPTFSREEALVGDLSSAKVDHREVRISGGHGAEQLRRWIEEIGPTLPTPVFAAVEDVDADGGDVVLRLADHVAPGLQEVDGRLVACHLHGIVPR
jgi:peptide/nickel transport system ATP-binding protein